MLKNTPNKVLQLYFSPMAIYIRLSIHNNKHIANIQIQHYCKK